MEKEDKKEGDAKGELKVTTDFWPIYEVRYNLEILMALIGVVLYMAKPDDEEPEKENIITMLACLQDQIAENYDALDGAIKNGILHEKIAPAAVAAAAGA